MMEDKVKLLMERIRGTATVATDAAVDSARVVTKKAGQMVDVAKLNVQLFDLNGELNDILRQLGQEMYQAHQGQESEGDPIPELLAKADSTTAKIKDVKARIADLRKTQVCPSCGNPCGKEDKFCRSCGNAL